MKNVAVVILNWNGKDLLTKFLPSIIRYSNPSFCTIYVIDNDSDDDSISFITKEFPTVKIVKNKSNYGFAKGYNVGLKNIPADFYALVNSDIEVTENWLEPIIKTFSKNEKVAIMQPKILDYKNKTKFEYAGAGGGFLDNFGYPYCRGRIFNAIEIDEQQYNNEKEIFWASGACMVIRKSVFNELKGFDIDFFAHQEEIDLCWRAKNLGYQIYYNGESTVYHVGGATLKENNPKKTFLNFRNNLLMLIKNLPNNKLFIIVALRLFLDGIAGVKFLLERKPLHTLAIIKAHFSMYAMLLPTLKKRKQTPKKTQKYYQTSNLVKQHFINNKNTFKQLN